MHDKKTNWNVFIPIFLSILFIAFSIGKLVQVDSGLSVVGVLDAINSGVFSTFISIVACMMYQFFTRKDFNKKAGSGLDPKWMWLTLVSTVIYSVVAALNAFRFCLFTCILMFIASVGYVVVFFKYMIVKG